MKRFAIYHYKYEDATMEDTLFADAPPPCEPVPPAERYKHLSTLFGQACEEFVLRGTQKGSEDYPGMVLLNQEGIVMLHLERPKDLDVWNKQKTPPGEFPNIKRGKVPSNPFCYIFIDCRQGHNKIAIEINTSAWRKTDEVKVLLAIYINKLLNNRVLGFNIKIDPETYSFDFLEQSRFHIRKNNCTVKWMMIHWNRGLIDPKVEAKVKKSKFFKKLFDLFSSASGDVKLNNPNVSSLIRKKTQLAEHFTMLMASEESDAFGVKLFLSNKRTYEWGEDIRIDFQMDDAVLEHALGMYELFGSSVEVAKWFNDRERDIEEERNATNTHRRRKKAHS